MKKLLVFLLFIFSFNFFIKAQNVGVNANGSTPNSSSILDLNTGNNFTSPNGKGLLIPNVSLTSTTDAVTIASPATSLLVYNTNTSMTGGWKGYWYWDGAKWEALLDNTAPGAGWTINGNTGITTPAIPATYGTSTIGGTENWLGTTDARDLVLGTNNIERMRIDNATGNIAIGSASPSATRTLYALYTGTAATGAAIWGSATGAAKVYGVFGSISSTTTDAAGVRGFSGAASGASAAVQGENQSADGYGVYGINTYGAGAGNNMYGVYGIKSGNAGTGTGFGIYGTASGTAATNIGGYFLATGGTNNIALRMRGSTSGNLDISPAATTTSYGLIMPSAIGTANQVLTISSVAGSTATLAWTTPSGSSSTSTSPYFATGSQSFSTVGANTFTVPAGVVQIKIWMVGAGGGYGDFQATNGGWGGYVYGIIDVTPAELLTVFIGAAGSNGGAGVVGGGGGGSYILRQTGNVLLAQAGGGGGGSNCATTCVDGNPGGTSFSAVYPSNGTAGTASAGGAGGSNYIAWVREASSFAGAPNMPTPTAFGSTGYGSGGSNAGNSVKGFVLITW